MTLFSIYNSPILAYAPFLWDKDRQAAQKIADQGHHRATRHATATAYRPQIPGYLTYEQRCEKLKVLPASRQREFQMATLAAKILAQNTSTDLTEILEAARFVRRERDRRISSLFEPHNDLFVKGGPLARIAATLNEYGEEIDFTRDSVLTIKHKIKKKLFERHLPYMIPAVNPSNQL